MAAELEFEVQVLAKAMEHFERRIEKELGQLETKLNESLGTADQQMEQAIIEVNEMMKNAVKFKADATEAELDEAIQATELAISRGQQSLSQVSNPANAAAIQSFRAQIQGASSQLDTLYDSFIAKLGTAKDQMMDYLVQNIAPCVISLEQYKQERIDATTALYQQLSSQ
jgi:hypothetical protein